MKKTKREPFVMLYRSVFESDAYRNLAAIERDILWLLISHHNGRNNGAIPLGIREAATWSHCSNTTAYRALKTLATAGFISITDKGRLVQSGDNRATRWRLNFTLPCTSKGT